ncbi:hypothetical protein C5167_046375 [Papaver somniferum]|uniref:Uncharacterized protein n=1 Tax=Papaver somniferum TaxID=3469 RepID=A0A4Y7LG23_PAPSO|nr:hypothetical protein C5167_046375 [Papaver somniferum]
MRFPNVYLVIFSVLVICAVVNVDGEVGAPQHHFSEDVVNDDGVGGAQNHSSDEDAIDEPRVLSPSQVIDAPAQEGETFVDPFILELFHAINQKVARKWVDFNVDVSGFHFSSKQKKLVQRDLPKKQRFVPQYFPSRWNDFVQAIESYEGFVHKKGRFGSRFTHPEFKVGTPHLI